MKKSPTNRPVRLRRLFAACPRPCRPRPQPKRRIVRVTMTSSWPTKSPDPMGLTYNPRTKKLLISDAEVDEMPALWKGKNLYRREAGRTDSRRRERSRSSRTSPRTSRGTTSTRPCSSRTTISIGSSGSGAGRTRDWALRDDVVADGPAHAPLRLPSIRRASRGSAVASRCSIVVGLHQPARVQDPPRQGPEVRHPRRHRAELRDPQVRVHDGRGRCDQGQSTCSSSAAGSGSSSRPR